MKTIKAIAAVAVASAFTMGVAHASPVTVAGVNYQTTDFASSLDVRTGDVDAFDITGASTDTNSALGWSANDGVKCASETGGCSFIINFANPIENQAGDDLVILGLGGTGSNEKFDLAYMGTRLTDLNLVDTGTFAGKFNIKSLSIDLTDLGVAMGDFVTRIKVIVNAGANREEFVGFASLNDDTDLVTPVPAAAWLFGSALFAGGFFKRKRKTA
ncbi:MAG: hypothetical protein AAFR21_06360 [Pseudomonadota bacterium]